MWVNIHFISNLGSTVIVSLCRRAPCTPHIEVRHEALRKPSWYTCNPSYEYTPFEEDLLPPVRFRDLAIREIVCHNSFVPFLDGEHMLVEVFLYRVVASHLVSLQADYDYRAQAIRERPSLVLHIQDRHDDCGRVHSEYCWHTKLKMSSYE